MQRFAGTVILLIAFAGSASAQSFWTNQPISATETVIGISLSGGDFGIGVGNAGQIVHFTGPGASVSVPSGTSKDLFDVFTVDTDFAVASGQDVVLLWDGMTWSPLFPENSGNPVFYTPVWAAADKDYLIYQQLSSGGIGGFNTVCPYVVSDPGSSAFCRLVSRPVLTVCGDSGDDVKVLQNDGTIRRFTDRTLGNLADPLDRALFEQPAASPLNLVAAFIPPEVCAPGNDAPPLIYAINQGLSSEFYHFNGTAWTRMGEAGTGEVLTGIAGISDTLVVAVGRRPPAGKGPLPNEGVAWAWDGSSWSNEELPPGTPGLADVATVIDFQDAVFSDGFEEAPAGQKIFFPSPVSTVAVGEGGSASSRPRVNPITGLPIPQGDVSIAKTLISPPDGTVIQPGQELTFRNVVSNRGTEPARQVRIHDRFLGSQLRLDSVSCPASSSIDSNNPILPTVSLTTIAEIAPMSSQTCDAVFTVLTGDSPISTGFFIENRAFITSAVADIDARNNVSGCTISSSGSRVACR